MGYIRNHTIVVSASRAERITEIHGFARMTFDRLCSPLVPHNTNGGAAFFIAPDGSKEGWDESDKGDASRASFIKMLKRQHPWLDWAEIVLGSDDGEYEILDHAEVETGNR